MAAAAAKKRVQIPTDLTTDILWRLPANACTFRFRCVSKSWRDFLSNPYYISQQLSGCADDSSSSDHKTMIKSGSFLSMSSVSIMHSDNTFEPLLPKNYRDAKRI
ncbi:unnamed protein product [Linum trigynum]|uniref:F-box domain-containing protein n=1 Tax=Linum trigynum TaxID=586398 RepID=A0AAV2FGN4_9ROSI